jgi:hypothetical protein
LSEFSFDQGGEQLTFSKRLARENGWSNTFAERVLEEYKRFIFLSMEAGHPVTPSDQVDQAWHLHLTYTDSYWNRLCKDILDKPIHHNPTKGGPSEGTKFEDCYSKTLQSYERLLGSIPPVDIWPEASIRFGKDLSHQRVNLHSNWVIPKSSRKVWAIGFLLLLICFAGNFLKSGEASAYSILTLADPTFIGIAVIALIVFLIALGSQRRNKCPKCMKIKALEKTGEKTKGGFFKPAKAEWKCKFCGFTTWYMVNQSGGCSAGCGSDGGGCGSGCGGCGS